MLKPGRKRWFTMPQPDNAGLEEQKQSANVYAVLRDHVAYAAAIRNEIRQARREQQELAMKVFELSAKVDTLIGVATDLKGRVDAGVGLPGSPVATLPAEDDPEVEALAHRIDDAIAVLKGTATTAPVSPSVPPPNQFDPNAPV